MASSEPRKKSQKLFTPTEANAMLPLVRVIVTDIVNRANDLRDRQERIERIRTSAATKSGDAYSAEIGHAEEELQLDQDQLLECHAELTRLGVELKDYFSGLVDFPSRMDGRIVYLCWRLDEPLVAHWHEMDAGFAGRQKLVEDCTTCLVLYHPSGVAKAMTGVVGYLLLFLFVSVTFLFFHLLMGKMIRPSKPDADKLTIYECGEPAIGSAWIQFDLRFYVVALLFVIFDVEVVFFFPWALVFGKANQLAMPQTTLQARNAVAETLLLPHQLEAWAGVGPVELTQRRGPAIVQEKAKTTPIVEPETAWQLAWLAFMDILVFFGVLLLGFAYLWKRGDLDWVRSTLAERPSVPPVAAERVLVGVDS